ncbi:hypothetical protein CDD83_4239 [Cordyceps sp. RAO-2017]|nr:hypothetical protein CDD83_4239 [Cordyceps sp. RAO-2017]
MRSRRDDDADDAEWCRLCECCGRRWGWYCWCDWWYWWPRSGPARSATRWKTPLERRRSRRPDELLRYEWSVSSPER